MDDRTQFGRVDMLTNHSAPGAQGQEETAHGDGRRGAAADERVSVDLSSSGKPALTERERQERWPVD